MKRVVAGVLLWTGMAWMLACGGGDSSSSRVTVSPASPSVASSGTVQFSAVVEGTSDNAVIWQVQDISGGNPTVGTISNTGLFTAPAVIPSGGSTQVTAVAVADSSQKTTVNVTITQGEPITIAISPTSATIRGGQSRQFTATVTPTTTADVNWQVNDTSGGSAENGAITSTGLYTAPTTVPANNVVTVKAVSFWDPSKTASAQVTISAAATVTVSPSNTAIAAGSTQTFTATSMGQPLDVTWENPRCGSTEPDGCGTITQAGVYTAPAGPPPGGTITLTATPVDETIPPGSAIVTVQYANGSFQGPYAFLFSGHKSGAVFVEAGSVIFDGQGNITGGSVDTDANATITGGTYQVNADGRGTATVKVGSKEATWRINVTSNKHALILRLGDDLTGTGTALAGGTLDLQDTSKFTSGSIQGNYGFLLQGASAGSEANSLGIVGALTADGAGSVSGGRLDANNGGGVTSPGSSDNITSGSYGPPDGSTGRGTLTITSNFAANEAFRYYVVDATRLNLIEANGSRKLAGTLGKQASGPFSATNVSGNYAFTFAGVSGSSPLAMGGTFALDGTGALTSPGADVNTNGTLQAGLSLAGTFSVSDGLTGRTTATFTVGGTDRSYVLYPGLNGKLNVLELESAQVLSGEALPRTGEPFSISTLKGNYAAQFSGVDLSSSPGPEQVLGLLVPNGGSAITGKLDIYAGGATPALDTALTTSSYSVSATTGTGTMTLRTASPLFSLANYRIYVVNPDTVLLLESDGSRFLVGRMEKQQ